MKIKRLTEFILGIIFLLFSIGFFINGQYTICFLTLGLTLITFRFMDLNKFKAGFSGVSGEFRQVEEKLSKVINSKKTNEEKVEMSQKLVDEIFKLGYQYGGKPFNDISNVKIVRDNNGMVTSIQYDEN